MGVSGAGMAPLNRNGGTSIVAVILMITNAAKPARSKNSDAPDPAVIDADRDARAGRLAGPSIQLRIHKQQLWGRQIVANRPGQRTG
jgi:hypothetical protein